MINSLHSHLHLSSFQRCFLLQTPASSLNLHLHVSTHYICLASLVSDIRMNTLAFTFLTTSGTDSFAYGLLILLQLPLHLLILILKGKKHRLIPKITIGAPTLHSRLFTQMHFNELTLGKLQPKSIIAEIYICFINPNILLYYFILFH